jgi:hypothetical protein
VVSELQWLGVATALYALTFPPGLRLARAEHITPAWLRAAWARLPLTLAALLMLLGDPDA